uniref:PDZ domain-containing protein n=1 Tax=Hemiselmis andersenii TaxID=464988 RepID=A0A6T8L2G3_HEMAN|mmetsp:Transcript_13135/g.30515  ORF Transcript_13135/g.30515 Transcript_13135/m.30515 type:complete len:268 (-) Transcript_13135:35-838(-)
MAFDAQWYNMIDQLKSDQTSRNLDDVQLSSHFKRMSFKPAELADEERSAVLLDVGTWAALDNAGMEKQGVGLFFEKQITGAVVIVSMVPGCAADRTGVVRLGDELLAVNQKDIQQWTLILIRNTIQGRPGSFVVLDLKRPETEDQPSFSYRINIMRGSPQFVENSARFGQQGAEKLNLLWDKLRDVERQYFRVHEKNQVEKARFEEACDRKDKAMEIEKRLERDLEALKRNLAHEQRKVQVLENKQKTLQEGLDGGLLEDEAGYFVC